MSSWVSDLIRSTGYTGIVLLMLMENIFPPIPSEVIMPLAGFLVSRQELHMAGVIISGTVGTVLGAVALYYLGYALGPEKLRDWCDRYGRWFVITREDVDKTERWFHRYGNWTVLVFRVVPGMRSLISIPAGVSRMPLWPFLIFTTFGSLIWIALLTWVGMILGSRFNEAQNYIGPVSTTVVAGLFAWYLWRVFNGNSRKR